MKVCGMTLTSTKHSIIESPFIPQHKFHPSHVSGQGKNLHVDYLEELGIISAQLPGSSPGKILRGDYHEWNIPIQEAAKISQVLVVCNAASLCQTIFSDQAVQYLFLNVMSISREKGF